MKSRINRDEREISISELWWYVISKWKWLVVGMVVGALLLGVYGAYKANQTNKNAPKVYTMEDLSETERVAVEELVEEYNFYLDKEKEYKDSYLMKLNSGSVYRCMITYYVDTDYSYSYLDVQENYATELVSMYKTYIASDEIRDIIMGLNIEGLIKTDLNYMLSSSNEGNIIKVTVCADFAECEMIANAVEKAVEEYKEEAVQSIGEHRLTKLSTDVIELYNETIKNGQIVKTSFIKGLSDEINTQKALFNAKQLAVYVDEISEENIVTTPSVSLFNKKYIAVGGLGGLFICAVIAIIVFIAGKTVKSSSEIVQIFGINVVGKILKDTNKNKISAKKINKIKGAKTELEQKQYIAEVLVNRCKNKDVSELVFCSTVNKLTDEMECVKEILNKDGISCTYVGDVNSDTVALNVAESGRNVVLVEQLNVTTKDDIDSAIELCDSMSVDILGIVVIV